MRITGGQYKGRKVIVPPGIIRPAMDRMREALFAVLGELRHCSFLDLYCGSGSVGIEAASRGAAPVVFVEKDRGKRPILQRNLAFVREPTEVHIVPVEHYLRRLRGRFDRIFLDPPFRQKGKLDVMLLIAARRILSEGGTLVIHVSKEEERHFPEVIGPGSAAWEIPAEPGGRLILSDRRRYGGSLLLFYG